MKISAKILFATSRILFGRISGRRPAAGGGRRRIPMLTAVRRFLGPWSAPRRGRLLCGEAGMATAEYAIATLAAVGFAGLLVVILRSEEVRGFLLNLVRTALSLP
ncbi:DUF4244 domain-containing protein [Arthrobacter sp. efr-133-TYG-104]|uniref:DUF4244 domain-containing protein n=1 Tax=Arthrobacter sp. efr-133-TYG-104 TaxID=3040324 RepID=UPI00254C121A|nr:DUF4244 domain-containing protein [Arthrobacter sp. efr-133-TYG-104]